MLTGALSAAAVVVVGIAIVGSGGTALVVIGAVAGGLAAGQFAESREDAVLVGAAVGLTVISGAGVAQLGVRQTAVLTARAAYDVGRVWIAAETGIIPGRPGAGNFNLRNFNPRNLNPRNWLPRRGAPGGVRPPIPPVEAPVVRVYHKGQLGPRLSLKREFSTGTDKSAVNALDRPGTVHEFAVPKDVIRRWEMEGKVRYLKDKDAVTGVINDEIRFSPAVADELIKYRVTK